MKYRTNKGFTLIEILIVVAIIGILASIVLVGLNPSKKAANDARRLSDLKQVQNALELFYNKCGYYPVPGVSETGSSCNDFTTHKSGQTPDPTQETVTWTGLTNSLRNSVPGVGTIPSDPVGGTFSYTYGVDLSDGQSYVLKAQTESNPQALKSSYSELFDIFGYVGFICDPSQGHYCIKF